MKSKNATRHTYSNVMKQLKAEGSAQTRKTYARHGMDVERFLFSCTSNAFATKFRIAS